MLFTSSGADQHLKLLVCICKLAVQVDENGQIVLITGPPNAQAIINANQIVSLMVIVNRSHQTAHVHRQLGDRSLLVD